MKSTLIPVEGESRAISPQKGKKFTLEELQKYVDGYLENVGTTSEGDVLIVNEEAQRRDLPINEQATVLFQAIRGIRGEIRGNAVLISHDQIA